MLKSFFHTGFVVQDLEKSVAFYRDVMKLKLAFLIERSGEEMDKQLGFDGAHIKVAFLNVDECHNLELVQYVFPPGEEPKVNRNDLGATHLAFFVDNIEKFHSDFSQRGLRFLGSPVSLMQDGKVRRKIAWAQDPDNNWLEFIEAMD